MSSPKELDFINGPLKDAFNRYKSVDEIGGISTRAKETLQGRGYYKAFHLIGFYLTLNMDRVLFEQWLRDLFAEDGEEVSDRNLDSICRCVEEWCLTNL